MYKCKQALEGSACGKDCCCLDCEDKGTCKNICTLVETKVVMNAEICEDAIPEEKELVVFGSAVSKITQTISNISREKERLEAEDKKMREELQKAMDAYGVKSFENEYVKITYVAPTTKTSVDSKKLKEKHPEVYSECLKTSDVKASVRITVK